MKQPIKTKKKDLCIILGGPKPLLKQRIIKTLQNINPDQYDFIFTGFRWELEFCEQTIQREFPELWKRLANRLIYIESFDTWTNLEATQNIWKKYKKILMYTEHFHGRRVKYFFKRLEFNGELALFDTGEKESMFAGFLCWFQSNLLGIHILSKAAKILRRSQLSSKT